MIDIDEIAYSDSRIDKLSREDRQRYDTYVERNRKNLQKAEDMQDSDLKEFVKSLVDIFFNKKTPK